MSPKKSPKTPAPKFKFTTEFQQNILQFILHDKNGPQALSIISENNFELIEHNVIALALRRVYRKNKRIPGKVIFLEYLRKLLISRDIKTLVSPEDANTIIQLTEKLYREPPRDGDVIFEECINFARYVKFREVIEGVDVFNYDSYQDTASKINLAINLGAEYKQDNITHLIEDIKKRQNQRLVQQDTFPTPFWQINELTNSGGYARGSLIAIIGRAKRFKTGMLINIARSYLRLRKRVIYFDFENGKESLSLRAEQALAKKTRKEIASGEFNAELQKIARKYKRLGAELTIVRCSAMSTTTDLQIELDKLYQNHGLKYHVAIIDYAALMGSQQKDKDDYTRIGNAYLNIKDWAMENQFELVFTANHVVRKAADLRESTKYQADDIAKCIDIHRHVDGLYGLNENEWEKENGVLRMELIDQRDGRQDGRAFFWVDYEKQLAREFTKAEFKAYQEQVEANNPQEKPREDTNKKPRRSGGKMKADTSDMD